MNFTNPLSLEAASLLAILAKPKTNGTYGIDLLVERALFQLCFFELVEVRRGRAWITRRGRAAVTVFECRASVTDPGVLDTGVIGGGL